MFISGGTPALRNQAGRELEIVHVGIPSGKAIGTYEGLEGPAVKIAQSVDSKYLFGICVRQPGSTPTLAAWDLTSGRPLWHFKPAKGEPELGTIAISKDGLVAVAWGPEAYVFEAKDGKAVATLDSSRKAVRSISFDPDSKRVWTVCGDNKIRVYEIATGKLAQTIEYGYAAWYDNQVLFRQGKPILMGFADYGVEEIPLDD